MSSKENTTCPGCSGTGQVSWFGGVSRFQFTYSDCPECNGTGILSATTAKQLQSIGETVMWQIKVDTDKCDGCGECVEGCPGEVYELVDKKATVVNEDECHGCHTCEDLCETDAIVVEEKE